MSEKTDFGSGADRAVEVLHRIDEKVDAMRTHRINDPDSFGDKIFKTAFPAVMGFAFSTLFDMVWKKGVRRKVVRADGSRNARQEAILGIAFTVLSAGLGALVSQLSERGSKAIVNKRHMRQVGRK